MVAVRHYGFLKVGNFNFRSGSEAHCVICQISRRYVEPFRGYGRFSIFQEKKGIPKKPQHVGYNSTCAYSVYGAVDRNRPSHNWRLSAILDFSKVRNFNCPYPSEGQNVSPIFDFQYGGRRHLRFWKFQIIFNGCDAQEGRTASACQTLSKSHKSGLRYGDFCDFYDGGRPPSWIFKS